MCFASVSMKIYYAFRILCNESSSDGVKLRLRVLFARDGSTYGEYVLQREFCVCFGTDLSVIQVEPLYGFGL